MEDIVVGLSLGVHGISLRFALISLCYIDASKVIILWYEM